jgi:hypothetical protein
MFVGWHEISKLSKNFDFFVLRRDFCKIRNLKVPSGLTVFSTMIQLDLTPTGRRKHFDKKCSNQTLFQITYSMKIGTITFGFSEKKTFFPAKSSFFTLRLIRIGRKKHFDAKRLIQSVFSVSRSMTI